MVQLFPASIRQRIAVVGRYWNTIYRFKQRSLQRQRWN